MRTPSPMMLWSVGLFLLLLPPQGVIPNRLSAAQADEPTFSSQYEVDPDWPRLPAQWKLGDASSFAVDGEDNVVAPTSPKNSVGRRLRFRCSADRGL